MKNEFRTSYQVLLVDPQCELPADMSAYLTRRGFDIAMSGGYAAALNLASAQAFDAFVMPAPPHDSDAAEPYTNLLRLIDARGAAALVLDEPGETPHFGLGQHVDYAPPQTSKEEIEGRLAVMMRYHGVVRTMERDLSNMQRLFKQLSGRFTEVDQEMRLAGRLQNAFLPHGGMKIGAASFSALYRPATFVSGDIYDIFRVDEDHVAFYIADAVGHGMAASLLTMFIKNAFVSKRIHDDHYEILDPDQSLCLLNNRLCEQQLPNSQFVTAAACLLNTRTNELRVSRAGHPYPLHVTADANMSEIKPPGGLLGLFEGEDFPVETLTMQPGEKLILYSDGLEVAFGESENRDTPLYYYHEALANLAHLPAEKLITEFTQQIEGEAGSLNPQDDITLVVLEIDAE